MENYKLVQHPITGDLLPYALRLSDGASVHRELNEEYLKWLEEGNTPLLADKPDPIPEPEPLTAQQKLEAAGLTIEELKDLLGI